MQWFFKPLLFPYFCLFRFLLSLSLMVMSSGFSVFYWILIIRNRISHFLGRDIISFDWWIELIALIYLRTNTFARFRFHCHYYQVLWTDLSKMELMALVWKLSIQVLLAWVVFFCFKKKGSNRTPTAIFHMLAIRVYLSAIPSLMWI